MKLDYPGPGGSFGECVVCGKDFALEVLFGRDVSMINMDGFSSPLPLHEGCLAQLQTLNGGDWTALPDGPLRREYASLLAPQTN